MNASVLIFIVVTQFILLLKAINNDFDMILFLFWLSYIPAFVVFILYIHAIYKMDKIIK